jgi:flagellar biosynthesis/type III secretory pathway protein FliH
LRARTIEYGSDFAKSYHAQGKAEGKAEGEAEGEARGEAKAVLTVLKARGIQITPSQQALVKGCASLAELDKWLERAGTASSADEVFA